MKYSLRSLMIVVMLGPAVVVGAFFLWPRAYVAVYLAASYHLM